MPRVRRRSVIVNLEAIRDRLRSSLFFVPMMFVIGGTVLGELMLVLDDRVEGVPTRLTATVDSARTVLSVVASATLTFAGIAFSVSLLLISLASSQFSPRVVHGLFRDPFNKRVMGIVIGTFTYCLIVLRAVRGPLEESGQGIVPSLSILLAVLLGVVSVLSIVGFISHSAHSMDVSKILHKVTADAIAQVGQHWPEQGDEDGDGDARPLPPPADGFTVRFDRHGWIQQIDHAALLAMLEPGSTMEVDTVAGRYAIPDTPFATAWPAPADTEQFTESARAAVVIGETRTMQHDVTYGVRQLADVALKALSPGINDPTTAQDAMFHLGAVVRELLIRDPAPQRLRGSDGQVLLLPQAISHEDIVALAFDEIRVAASGQPTVVIYLLEILHLLALSLDDDRVVARDALRRQADLVVTTSELADVPAADHERVRAARAARFPS